MKDLSMHILDIAQNSIRAKAKFIRIDVAERSDNDQLIITITDDGPGMSPEQLKQATDPFYTSRTTRKVGLGLSLLKQNTEMTGGFFKLESTQGKGTKVTATFGRSHIDRPIMGDLVGTLLILFCTPDNPDYLFSCQTPSGTYSLDTREAKKMLGNIPLSHPDIRKFLKEMIEENLKQIQLSE